MPGSRPSTADKRKTFRKLHEAGCFVIPNPWNVGSARYLQGLGFKALATTSAGHAHAQGFADGAQSRDDVLAHYRELARMRPEASGLTTRVTCPGAPKNVWNNWTSAWLRTVSPLALIALRIGAV